MKKQCWRVLAPALIALWFVFGLCNIFLSPSYGNWGGDEVWYTNTSRLLWQGRELYRDVRFWQMPLSAYIYAPFSSINPPTFNWVRLEALVLATVGLWCIYRVVAERFGLWPTIVTLLSAFIQPFPSQVASVFTQPISFCFVGAVILCLHRIVLHSEDTKTFPPRTCLICGLLCGFSVLARLSFLPMIFIAPAYLYFIARKDSIPLRTALISFLWGLAPSVAMTAYYLTTCPAHFLFGVYGFSTAMGEGEGLLNRYHYFLIAWANDSFLWIGILFAALLFFVWKIAYGKKENTSHFEYLMLALYFSITLIHATRKQSYAVHQVALVWGPIFFTAWMVDALGRVPINYSRALNGCRAGALYVITFITVAGFLQSAYSYTSKRRSHKTMVATAESLHTRFSSKPLTLLAFDPAWSFSFPNLKLIQGYEMGIYSVYPETLNGAMQEFYRGVSQTRFQRDLKTRADIIIVTDDEITSIPRPMRKDLFEALHRHYAVTDIDWNWPGGSTLLIARRRSPGISNTVKTAADFAKFQRIIAGSIY